MNISLIYMEGNYGAIDADDSTVHGYYIMIFSSYTYTLQEDLSIYGQVTSSDEMVSEGFFSININPHYYVSPKNKPNNTIVSLRKMINGNVNLIRYYSKDYCSILFKISFKENFQFNYTLTRPIVII